MRLNNVPENSLEPTHVNIAAKYCNIAILHINIAATISQTLDIGRHKTSVQRCCIINRQLLLVNILFTQKELRKAYGQKVCELLAWLDI